MISELRFFVLFVACACGSPVFATDDFNVSDVTCGDRRFSDEAWIGDSAEDHLLSRVGGLSDEVKSRCEIKEDVVYVTAKKHDSVVNLTPTALEKENLVLSKHLDFRYRLPNVDILHAVSVPDAMAVHARFGVRNDGDFFVNASALNGAGYRGFVSVSFTDNGLGYKTGKTLNLGEAYIVSPTGWRSGLFNDVAGAVLGLSIPLSESLFERAPNSNYGGLLSLGNDARSVLVPPGEFYLESVSPTGLSHRKSIIKTDTQRMLLIDADEVARLRRQLFSVGSRIAAPDGSTLLSRLPTRFDLNVVGGIQVQSSSFFNARSERKPFFAISGKFYESQDSSARLIGHVGTRGVFFGLSKTFSGHGLGGFPVFAGLRFSAPNWKDPSFGGFSGFRYGDLYLNAQADFSRLNNRATVFAGYKNYYASFAMQEARFAASAIRENRFEIGASFQLKQASIRISLGVVDRNTARRPENFVFLSAVIPFSGRIGDNGRLTGHAFTQARSIRYQQGSFTDIVAGVTASGSIGDRRFSFTGVSRKDSQSVWGLFDFGQFSLVGSGSLPSGRGNLTLYGSAFFLKTEGQASFGFANHSVSSSAKDKLLVVYGPPGLSFKTQGSAIYHAVGKSGVTVLPVSSATEFIDVSFSDDSNVSVDGTREKRIFLCKSASSCEKEAIVKVHVDGIDAREVESMFDDTP